MSIELMLGDCIDAMKAMPDNSIDAVVTDPPYGLQFMGKEWDKLWRNNTDADKEYQERTKDKGDGLTSRARNLPDYSAINNLEMQHWHERWATEVYRILKPGGHLLSFGGSRTYHRMACAIEDAGFEIRDQLQWIYGSGFPKSLDVSKAIDKMAGAYVKGEISPNSRTSGESPSGCYGVGVQQKTIDIPQSPEAQYWQGWGTALKPAHEPIVLARKPITGTVAQNVLAYGTGGINIDGCRVGTEDNYSYPNGAGGSSFTVGGGVDGTRTDTPQMHPHGRFPANILHDGSDEVVGMFPVTTSGNLNNGHKRGDGTGNSFMGGGGVVAGNYGGDSGSAARFFYSAKASRSERNAGLEMASNGHPTVKPIAVMRWLVRLITPPNGTVLDPFTGSGTTGIAAVLEGFDFIGIEREAEYHEIARRRIEHWQSQFQMRLPLEAE